MKKLPLILSSVFVCASLHAQLNGDGYYRVLNQKTSRYITVQDNRGSIDIATTKADLLAIKTVRGFDRMVDDPASVIYIESVQGQYNLKAQGTDTKVITGGRYLNLKKVGPTYQAYGKVNGMEIYLSDEENLLDPDTARLVQNGNGFYRNWYILPVNQADNQYFGLRPELSVGGHRYLTFYASFPFNLQSSGMKAYTVTKVDGDMAVWKELSGTVPMSTPVIVMCSTDNPSTNRLDIVNDNNIPAQTDNLLQGVYFCNGNPGDTHFNKVTYDANTMRVLGVTSKGRLGFVKYQGTYLPKNRAYLVVPAGSPDELTLMTQAEYDAEKAKDDVVVTAVSCSRLYGDENPTFTYTTTGHELKGEPVLSTSATKSSPVGVYDIVVGRGSVTNNSATFVNGTLTVTPAPLSITARSYTIKQNEPLPQFGVDYSGFKVADTEASLTTLPQVIADVPADKTPGTYRLVAAGATSANYAITYAEGTLTILEADAITVKADNVTMAYGDEVPRLTYTVEGGTLQGEPVITCEATSQSSVGVYAVKVSRGSIDYPNLLFVDGALTVVKAPLVASVGSYTRFKGEANPEFEVSYEGFRNADTESVLITKPVATTEATADSPEGQYVISLSGGEAQNYEFTYVSGMLTVLGSEGLSAPSVKFTSPVDVYTLTGRKVRSQVLTLASLPKGVYVVNGRKVVVR